MSRVQQVNRVRELIDQYWDIAYQEGLENRDYDKDGCAQKTISEIEFLLQDLKSDRYYEEADILAMALWQAADRFENYHSELSGEVHCREYCNEFWNRNDSWYV